MNKVEKYFLYSSLGLFVATCVFLSIRLSTLNNDSVLLGWHTTILPKDFYLGILVLTLLFIAILGFGFVKLLKHLFLK